MKYKVFLIGFFMIMPAMAYSQTVTLKIIGDGENLIGAHVYANDKIVTATNVHGVATVNANAGDKLRISHIGYNDETIAITQKMIATDNITVYMQPTVFYIDEVKVTRAKSDMALLKAKLKKGLKLRVNPDMIDFVNIDTILDINDKGYCIDITGNAIFKNKGKNPIISINSIKLTAEFNNYTADTTKLENSDSIKLKISTKVGNSMAAAQHIYQFRKMKVFYRGKEDNKDIFHFSLTIPNEENYKVDGLVYLNEYGIIERINYNGIASTPKYATGNMDTLFEYFNEDNTILPKSYLRKIYYFNDNMEIIKIENESLELFYYNKKE